MGEINILNIKFLKLDFKKSHFLIFYFDMKFFFYFTFTTVISNDI